MSLKFNDGGKPPKPEYVYATCRELLVYAASKGALKNLEVPDWATGGTNFEEMLNALKTLGKGEWLEDFKGYGQGLPEDGDRWFREWCAGRKVPSPSDDPDD